MASPFAGIEVDKALRPSAAAFTFDLNACLASVVALEASVAADASTAEALGTNRIGNGIVIGAEGLRFEGTGAPVTSIAGADSQARDSCIAGGTPIVWG